jgi:hypothetical protein
MKYKALLMSAILASVSNAASIIDVLPNLNNTPITQAVFEVNGQIVTQNSEVLSTNSVSTPVYLRSLSVNDNGTIVNLNYFNDLGASITNVNLLPTLGGVGVLNGADKVTLTSGVSNFAAAASAASQNTNILNYVYYDYLTSVPTIGVPDYSILFSRAYEAGDYVMVAERWSNSQFSLRALDQFGNVIPGSNTVRFAGNAPIAGDGTLRYDWQTGYSSSSYYADQPFGISVAKVDLFFSGTGVTQTPVFGFLIDNDGEADFKLLGLSSDTFTNNVPEPSSAILFSFVLLVGLSRRTRN